MEDELKCPVCKQFFCDPILMPCYHTLCLNCALNLQQPVNLNPNTPNSNNNNNNNVNITSPINTSNSSTYIVTATVHQSADELVHTSSISGDISATSSTAGSEISDADKLSLLSETDSGVICNSRPNSYVGTPSIQGILFPPLQSSNAISLSCPVCHKLIYLDENGANNLPKNRTMLTIVDKFADFKNLSIHCQLCEGDPKEASIMCEQCEIYYCDSCRESCHPQRGPLASHKLIAAHLTKNSLRSKTKGKDTAPKCGEHTENPLSSFCMLCKIPICNTCAHESRHSSHDIQALGIMCKALKVSLTLFQYSLNIGLYKLKF
jgi:tripartite motif-containing protein 9/67